mmetsp:Transcript_6915/g.19438  ORF Transcript_6915/g.19438 Transcript_6915/m.19438 type:complete len:249 (+) Transcript_6915:280-1026(+)
MYTGIVSRLGSDSNRTRRQRPDKMSRGTNWSARVATRIVMVSFSFISSSAALAIRANTAWIIVYKGAITMQEIGPVQAARKVTGVTASTKDCVPRTQSQLQTSPPVKHASLAIFALPRTLRTRARRALEGRFKPQNRVNGFVSLVTGLRLKSAGQALANAKLALQLVQPPRSSIQILPSPSAASVWKDLPKRESAVMACQSAPCAQKECIQKRERWRARPAHQGGGQTKCPALVLGAPSATRQDRELA